MTMSCRFYEQLLPTLEEVVCIRICSISELGVYVQLLEYNNIEGLILKNELSRRRIRSINKLAKIGSIDYATVLRIDSEKGYIDLSKRRVTADDRTASQKRFAEARCVNSILRDTARLLEYDTDDQLTSLYKNTAWKFDELQKEPGFSYSLLRKAALNPDILNIYGLDETLKVSLLKATVKRLKSFPFVIKADIGITCYTEDGIDAVRNSLKAGLEVSSEENPTKIRLQSSPIFEIIITRDDEHEAFQHMSHTLERIKQSIEEHGGCFQLKEKPRVMTVVNPDEDTEMNRELNFSEAHEEASANSGPIIWSAEHSSYLRN